MLCTVGSASTRLLVDRVAGIALSLCLLASIAIAEDPLPDIERLKTSPVLRHLRPNPLPSPPGASAEQTLRQMYLPEGFRAKLVASEPDVRQPIAFAFDEQGRIWVAEAFSYPTRRPVGEGLDKIVILEDRDGDGRFETRKIFAEGLNLVSGLEIGYGGVWVGAAPELLFIPDRNHDDVPDAAAEVLLDGFGYQDTHECLNSFLWGPDGWLYGNQGVFNYARIGKPGSGDAERVELRAGVWRYHPVRRKFEVFAHGGSNQWGLDYDEHGQLFMTHCRSYWGLGPTTHVIQGGHYWNQANANHAPFIIANPPEDFPSFRNYLFSSARYDHGAGGAGKPGSDLIYGGHSHVGTMIYLGDNWPAEFRGHLFTHNLHGHQINQQVNHRLGSGFDTVHAGQDMFFCSDPRYVAVDLQYGPDGAVYVIDWYDQQHCHNPNTDSWDRGNGRIYRIEYAATYQHRKVDLASFDDAKLVELQQHRNEWYVRTARRLLHERSTTRAIDSRAAKALAEMARRDALPSGRLRALWTLNAIGAFSESAARQALTDPDEFVRGWAIQLLTDNRKASPVLLDEFVRLAKTDPSPVVRLYLASAIQRVPESTAWELIAALAQHGQDSTDRNLPLLLWYGLAKQMPGKIDNAFAIADRSTIPELVDWIYWYAATLEPRGLDRVVTLLDKAEGKMLRRRLAGVELATSTQAKLTIPPAWKNIAPKLYANDDTRVQRQAERLAAAFGDASMFPRLREALDNTRADAELRRHAFAVLGRAQDRASLPVFLRMLDDASFRPRTINLLARFDSPEIPEALLDRFDRFSSAERAAALQTLTSRVSFAVPLLDAVATGRIKRDQLTAFHVRQLAQLNDAGIDKRVVATWGTSHQSPAEQRTRIARLEKIFAEAPLWAYSGGAGREHFLKLCSQCHRLGNDGNRIGPELTGAGKNGIRYYLENIIDPDAVIGADFQMTTVETRKGDVISGLVAGDSLGTLTIRTVADQIVIAKDDVIRRTKSEKSLMPEGLLESLTDREQLELLKYLTSN